VERALGRGVFAFEVVEEVIDDLAVVEADLGERAAADLHHLVDVPFLAGVGVIYGRILGIFRRRTRDHFGSAQGGLMTMVGHVKGPRGR